MKLKNACVCLYVGIKTKSIKSEIKLIIMSTKLILLFISLQLQRDKETLFVSHIAASCLLHSAAAAVKWDTMMAASWGSNTTYTWKITSRSYEHYLCKKHSGDGVTFCLQETLLWLGSKPYTFENSPFSCDGNLRYLTQVQLTHKYQTFNNKPFD